MSWMLRICEVFQGEAKSDCTESYAEKNGQVRLKDPESIQNT